MLGRAIVIVCILASAAPARAETPTDVGLVLGLVQPVMLGGFNAEVDAHIGRWSFEYSHGASLDFTGSLVVGDAHDQHLAYHLPYSTGFGIGYRVTRSFDVRLEPKLHAFQVYYDGDRANRVVDYKTFTLGVGAYYRWLPFGGRSDWARGLAIIASARFWPNIYDTLGDFRYMSSVTHQMETLAPARIGIANTPFIANLSVGYVIWP